MHITNAETDVDAIDQIAYAPEMLLVELLVCNIEWIYCGDTVQRNSMFQIQGIPHCTLMLK